MIRVGALIVLSGDRGGARSARSLWPYDPAAQELARRLEAPSLAHPLGLDELGRDILARLLQARASRCSSDLAVVSVSSIVGMLFGSIAGYFGGRVDDVISRVMDVLMAFPGILLAIALVAVLGPEPDQRRARAVGDRLGRLRAARAGSGAARARIRVRAGGAGLGAGAARIVLRHVLPTAIPAVVVQATLGMAGAIIAEASLSFLGLGVQPPTPSWGTMLDAGRAHLFDAPHLTIFPGLAIATLVLGFNFLGDGLRDRVDPKMVR